MKRKMWVTTPLMYIMAVIMLLWACFTFKYNKILFAVELTVSGIALIATLLIDTHFISHVYTAMRTATRVLSAEEENNLNELPMGLVVVSHQGDIIWCNEAFKTGVAAGEEVRGTNILTYIHPRTLRQLTGEKNSNITHGGREYTVYTSKTEDSYIMYFVDDTYYKTINREFREKRPVVAIISFDNKEEILRDASGGDESRITAEVEAVLREWATAIMGGFVRRLSGGRYIMFTDELHMEEAKKRRFEILDRVRKVKGVGNLSATISIGVGRGAASAAESEAWARQALEMALGRGGDQVAIMKKGDTYEFYGGLSKGVEKRDKVRTRVIAATLSDHVKNCDKVFIMGHKYSDLDAIGSAVGMWAATTRGLGKPAYVVVNKNTTLAKPLIDMVEAARGDKEIFISPAEAVSELTGKSMLIVVDTHAANFVESTELLEAAGKVVVIDHHRMMVTHIKNSAIFYHEPYASSASEMVAELVQYIGGSQLSGSEANALLAGIMLDTKNFVMKTGVRTFEASAYLRRRGADTVQVKKLFANSMNTNKEKAALVAGADIYKGCAIASTQVSTADTRVAAAQAADEMLAIQGVRASFVLFRVGNEISISARSMGEVNVQVILEAFGGGGHLTMAGAQLKDTTIEDTRIALIDVLNERLLPEAVPAQGSTGKDR